MTSRAAAFVIGRGLQLRSFGLVLIAALAAVVAGCTPIGVSLGTNRSPCGSTTCGSGFYCCNESCEICAPEGTGCVEIACGGDCDPQDVTGSPCIAPMVLGFAWNGGGCVLLSGCSCDGADCGEIYDTMEACTTARAGCMPGPRPCVTSADCTPGELCDYSGDDCGVAGTTGFCRSSIVGSCIAMGPACGCDGRDYASTCDAELSGTDVAFMGPCTPDFECGPYRCQRHTEVCIVPPGGVGLGTGYCEPTPTDCPMTPCDCARRTGMCIDDFAGAVTIER